RSSSREEKPIERSSAGSSAEIAFASPTPQIIETRAPGRRRRLDRDRPAAGCAGSPARAQCADALLAGQANAAGRSGAPLPRGVPRQGVRLGPALRLAREAW